MRIILRSEPIDLQGAKIAHLYTILLRFSFVNFDLMKSLLKSFVPFQRYACSQPVKKCLKKNFSKRWTLR